MTTVILLQNHKIQQALIIMSDKSRKNRLTFCHTFSIQFTHIHTDKHIYTDMRTIMQGMQKHIYNLINDFCSINVLL